MNLMMLSDIKKGNSGITYKMKAFEQALKVLELYDPGYHENTNLPFSTDSRKHNLRNI